MNIIGVLRFIKKKTRETIFSGQVNVIVFLLQLVGVEIMNNFVRKRLESYRKLKVLSRKTKYKRFVEVYDKGIFVVIRISEDSRETCTLYIPKQ